MNILCVIDSFGSGGAQRQFVTLACGLKARGHDVEIFVYHPERTFFKVHLERAGIPIHAFQKRTRLGIEVVAALTSLTKSKKYDAVISFLDTPNIYCEVARLFSWGRRLIVSERSSHLHDRGPLKSLLRRILHAFSSHVVTNSRTHAEWLRRHSWLTAKTITIYNGYTQAEDSASALEKFPPPRLLVVGRIGPEKNGVNLAKALILLNERHGYAPEINWAGAEDTSPAGQAYLASLKSLLDSHPQVKASWHWLGERQDIPELMSQHRALVHPSLYEGLPNVVCEALTLGRPVVVSNVCDHPYLVESGKRGFLCDPKDPQSIAAAIDTTLQASEEDWRLLSANAKQYAVEHLGIDVMLSKYEALLDD